MQQPWSVARPLVVCCLAGLAAQLSACGALSSAAPPAARSGPAQASSNQATEYSIVELGTVGGSVGLGISITDAGKISGLSSESGDGSFHAALWLPRSTQPLDLGTLGGANSAVEWPNHDEQEVVGISQTSRTDPLGEQWSCSAFIPYTGNTCLGFVWRANHMLPLPTLGGNNGYAAGVNRQGDVAGWAETGVHDGTCTPPQVLQFEAVVLDRFGRAHELRPLNGDPDSAATAIDDSGDVVGISGICQNAVGALSAEHPVRWHDGVPMALQSLGGAGWNTPAAMSDNGEVVGFSDLPGDNDAANPNFHAVIWNRDGTVHDIGTLPGDVMSEALGVNDSGQVVGLSCPTSTCAPSRAFLYENGQMIDLNSIVPAGSPYLIFANDINDSGEVTGLGVDAKTGAALAFRGVPTHGASGSAVIRRAVRPPAMHIAPSLRRLLLGPGLRPL